MADWSHELIFEFLDVYRNEPILWDPLHMWHKDKTKINDAWLRVGEILQRPVSELKKKKDSLMATFRGHLRKKKASIKSATNANDVYKPVWFAYEFMESFLGPVYESSPILELQDMSEAFVNGAEDDERNEPVIIEVVTSVPAPMPAPTSTPITTPVRRRSEFTAGVEYVKNRIKEVIYRQSGVKRTNGDEEEEEDDCDLFAKILAKKLRRLPDYERLSLMYEIDGMFINRLCHDNPAPLTAVTYSHTLSLEHLNGSESTQNSPFNSL